MSSSRARRRRPRSSAVESAPPLTAISRRLPGGTAHGPRRAQRRTGSSRRNRMVGGGMLGGGAGTRTPDTEIMILLLYQLSYAAPKVEGSVLTTGCAAGQPAGSAAFRAIVAQPGGALLLHRRGAAR